MEFLWLCVGLALILVGANYLTEGSATVAQRFRVPEFIIGLTIVAVGTSAPELVVSVLSALRGEGAVAIGNVVGSNLFNVFMIGGLCAVLRPLPLTAQTIKRDIPFGVGASLLLLLFTSDSFFFAGSEPRINRLEGVVMLLAYVGLMSYTIRLARKPQTVEVDKSDEDKSDERSLGVALLMIVGGLAGLIYGGNLFLEKAILIAKMLGVSESVIAITLVAGGTSFPELASSLVSVVKGRTQMALGNIIGSNIANILLILGVSSSITPLSLGGITVGDILMVLLSSVLLFVAAYTFRRKEIDRIEGVILLAIYGGYIYWLLA